MAATTNPSDVLASLEAFEATVEPCFDAYGDCYMALGALRISMYHGCSVDFAVWQRAEALEREAHARLVVAYQGWQRRASERFGWAVVDELLMGLQEHGPAAWRCRAKWLHNAPLDASDVAAARAER